MKTEYEWTRLSKRQDNLLSPFCETLDESVQTAKALTLHDVEMSPSKAGQRGNTACSPISAGNERQVIQGTIG